MEQRKAKKSMRPEKAKRQKYISEQLGNPIGWNSRVTETFVVRYVASDGDTFTSADGWMFFVFAKFMKQKTVSKTESVHIFGTIGPLELSSRAFWSDEWELSESYMVVGP